MTIKALVLPHDDDTAHVRLITPDLRTLQGLVGGMFQVIPLAGRGDMWLNEEGKLHGLPRNHNADAVLAAVGQELLPGDYIVGTVVLTGTADGEGEATSVSNTVLGIVEGLGIPIDG